MGAQLHAAHALHRLRPQHLAGKFPVLRAALLAGDPVDPLFVVELPHQVDDEVAFFCKGAVRALQHIPAELRACFLQRRNGRSSGQTAGRAALVHVPVSADLLQLCDAVLLVSDGVGGQRSGLQLHEAPLIQTAHQMYHVFCRVQQLVLVHARRVRDEVSLLGRRQRVLVHGLGHPVDGVLGVLHHVDVSESRRAVLFHKEWVEHEGIFSVVIETGLGHLRVVLTGVEHHAVAELAVMHHGLAAGLLPLVVPVHHHALFAGVDVLVTDVLPHGDATAARLALELRPPGRQTVVVGQRQREEVGRVLDVLHARLPVEHQKVHAPDGDVPKALSQRRVPENALDAGTLLELAPPRVAVHALVVRLFQHHRQNVGEEPRRLLVVLRPRQHVRLRVVVHGVGVFVGDGVEQPPRAGGALALHHPVAILLPVAQLVPFLVVDDPLVETGFGRFVLFEDGHRLADLLLADRRFTIQHPGQTLAAGAFICCQVKLFFTKFHPIFLSAFLFISS